MGLAFSICMEKTFLRQKALLRGPDASILIFEEEHP
jgi:hypothetical protein